MELNLVKEQFENKGIHMLIGFGRGFNGFSSVPLMIKNQEGLKDIIFNEFCNHNLTTYLIEVLKANAKKEETMYSKVGILVKPCDGKSVVELIRENKVLKDNIVVFSLPCRGIIDKNKLFSYKETEIESIESIHINGSKVDLGFGNRQVEVELSDLLENKCLKCDLNTSPIADYVIGEKALQLQNPKMRTPMDKGRDYWMKEYARCIRCNACRKVCPMCYCTNCVLEKESPRLLKPEVNADENGVFLMVRAMHMAGRCTGCGRCKEVCPVNIDHAGFHMPVANYVAETFEFKAGENLDEKPVLSCSSMLEKEDFR